MKKQPPRGGPAPTDDDVPSTGAVPTDVDQPDSGTVVPAQDDGKRNKVPSAVLLPQLSKRIDDALLQGQITQQLVDDLRVLALFVLMAFKCPPNLPNVGHTPNADTKLLPGIVSLLKAAATIQEEEPRAVEGVDLAKVALRKDLLVLYRAMWQVFKLAADSMEAGVTHLENYLDGTARQVYPHVSNLIATDREVEQVLKEFEDLVAGSSQLAHANQRINQRHAAPPPPATPAPPNQTGTPPAGQGQGGTGPVISGPLPSQGPAPATPGQSPPGPSPQPPRTPRPRKRGGSTPRRSKSSG